MTESAQIPELPKALRAPEPVIIAGMLAWLVATLVIWLLDIGDERTLWVAITGLLVGVAGSSIVVVQRRAARRGDRTAQEGLEGLD